MKRRQILVNDSLKRKDQREAKRKIEYLLKASGIVENHVGKIKDLNKFIEKGFANYLFEEYVKQNPAFKNASMSSTFSFFEVDNRVLSHLEGEFKRINVELNEDCTGVKEKDYGVYTESKEENERLDHVLAVKQFAEDMESRGIKVNYFHLASACFPLTSRSNIFQPNLNYIKGRSH